MLTFFKEKKHSSGAGGASKPTAPLPSTPATTHWPEFHWNATFYQYELSLNNFKEISQS